MSPSDQEMVHCCCKRRHFKMTIFLICHQLMLLFTRSVMYNFCDPIVCTTQGFSVLHCLPEFILSYNFCDPIVCTTQSFSVLHCLPEFSFSPSNKYSGLISFRIDWFDVLAVQGTHKNLLQHHSSKTSILWCSAFFMVQLSHPYITTGKKHSFDFYRPLLAK